MKKKKRMNEIKKKCNVQKANDNNNYNDRIL